VSKKNNKNLFMIVTLASTGVVAVGLLIFMVIVFFQWNTSRKKTITTRETIQKLVASKPAPGKENEARIQDDIDFYTKVGKGLVDNFKSPLNVAVDIFIDELQPPNISALTTEEQELYKVEGSGVEATDEKPAVPLKIRKLTRSEFKEFFQKRFDEFCSKKNISEDRDKISLTTLRNFISECRDIFPTGNWNSAVAKFTQAARPLTYEVIDGSNELPILLSAMGMIRRVDDQPGVLRNQVSSMILKIKGKVRENIQENMKVALNGKEPDEALLNGAVDHFFAADALAFIGGGREEKHDSLTVAEYPMAFFHWDVFGDIAARLSAVRVHTLVKVILRGRNAEDGGDGTKSSGKVNLAESFEEDGNFKLHHYTVVFTGDMNSIREVVKSFDNAWRGDKNGNGRRMYIVRSLALYATDNGAVKIIEDGMADEKKEQSTQQNNQPRRRRRRIIAENQSSRNQDGSRQTEDVKSSAELSVKEARERYYDVMIRLEKEEEERKNPPPPPEKKFVRNQDGTISEVLVEPEKKEEKQLSAEEKEAFYDKYEDGKPENLRFGYGQTVIGNHSDECLAYLDIDYVVLEQK